MYTVVNKWGNSILFRGYTKEGKPIKKKVKFKPELFVTDKDEQTEWKTLDGLNVEPLQFEDMNSAKNFMDTYRDVDNFKLYGNTNFVSQFIQKAFPDRIEFDSSKINIGIIDIEVASDKGFPEPSEAEYPIISIAYKNNQDPYYHVWGLDDFDPLNVDTGDDSYIRYSKCKDEEELLLKFLHWWSKDDNINTPDILTGWNIRGFDIPYIINRSEKVCGEKVTKQISPWNIYRYRKLKLKTGVMDSYDIFGISQMDYMDLFKKFGYSYGTQASYSLDNIANVVLGEKKISYEDYGSLHDLYRENHQLFIEYNIKDVSLVNRIDEETSLLELALTLAYRGGTNYVDALGTTALWDSIICRYLTPKKIAIPPMNKSQRLDYPGGYVKEPQKGIHEWVMSFDLASLYPNLIIQYNMSPETIVDDDLAYPNGVDYFMNNAPEPSQHCVAGNGVKFRNDERGMLPSLIIEMYDERKVVKEEMLKVGKEIEKNGETPALKKKRTQLHNKQMSIKIAMNSLYGSLGTPYFRYYDHRIAEGITISGQLTIRWAEKTINEYLNKLLDVERDRVIAIDTDSVYVSMSDLVGKVNPDNPVEFLDTVGEKKLQPLFDKSYTELNDRMYGYENRMNMSREAIADKGVWAAKKRYILNVHNNEGVQYSEPKLKIMGLEAVKSSTPQVVRDKFKKAFIIILTQTEVDLQKFVSDFYNEFISLPAEDVSFPRGVSDIEKWKDKKTRWKKGCPIHVRGAIIYNQMLKDYGLSSEEIKNGSKVKFCYLKLPNPSKGNVIAFPQFLPKKFNLNDYVDKDTQFEKTFKEPLSFIANAVGWELSKSTTLEDFFS
jgi:DNA polymerase elongation subunit (family B)